jgi:hypothetical protein
LKSGPGDRSAWALPRSTTVLRGGPEGEAAVRHEFGWGEFEIDVVVRGSIERPGVDFGGRARRRADARPAGGLEIALLDGTEDRTVSTARTGAEGEFLLRASADRVLGIRIGPPGASPPVLVWGTYR